MKMGESPRDTDKKPCGNNNRIRLRSTWAIPMCGAVRGTGGTAGADQSQDTDQAERYGIVIAPDMWYNAYDKLLKNCNSESRNIEQFNNCYILLSETLPSLENAKFTSSQHMEYILQ